MFRDNLADSTYVSINNESVNEDSVVMMNDGSMRRAGSIRESQLAQSAFVITSEDYVDSHTTVAPHTYKKPETSGGSCRLCCRGACIMLLVLGALLLALGMGLNALGLEFSIGPKPSDDLPVVVPDIPDIPDDGEFLLPREPLIDEDTRVPFPALILGPANEPFMGLGVGVRQKTIGPIKVNIYSVALYVEPELARTELAWMEGKGSNVLRAMPEFYTSLRDSSFDFAVRIVMTFTASKAQLEDSLSEALMPRLLEFAPSDAIQLRAHFQALFTEDSYKTGDTLLFTGFRDALNTTRFTFSVNADTRGRAISGFPDLRRAFLAIYTDEHTPAPTARYHFPDRAPLLWQRPAEEGDGFLEILSESEDTILVQKTKHTIPVQVHVREKPSMLEFDLAATGASDATQGLVSFLKVPLYSVALYRSIPEWDYFLASQSLSVNASNVGAILIKAKNVTRSVRVEMATDISAANAINTFGEKMKPTLQSLLDTPMEVDNALRAFRNTFTYELKNQEVLFFHCSRDGRLYSVVNQVSRKAIPKHLGTPLCEALFSLYLGASGESVLNADAQKNLVRLMFEDINPTTPPSA
jgi:hypothetical protein